MSRAVVKIMRMFQRRMMKTRNRKFRKINEWIKKKNRYRSYIEQEKVKMGRYIARVMTIVGQKKYSMVS